MYITGIGQAVLESVSFKVEPGNYRRGISSLQKFSEIFGNIRLVSLKMTSHLFLSHVRYELVYDQNF